MREPENIDHLSTEETHFPSDNYPMIISSSHSHLSILWRMSLSSRLAYRRRHCQNCNENGHKGGFCRESSTSSSTRQSPNNKRA
ncbi:unnamed protein product [Hymenolepis diminuta]|uniref:Uncharacterized protein n=1 Tax=Hymenolepis diminuta TaxID=6216 RepID=A0A564Z7Q7_HYMDI|nr:unnamed protein product [Hymenolepis diminuta]